MADLTTVRNEAQAAVEQLAGKLSDVAKEIVAKEGELADLLAKKAGIAAEHAIVVAMADAGKIVTAVELEAPKIEKEIAAVVSNPKTRRIAIGGAILIGGGTVLYVIGHFLFGWPL